VLTNTSANNDEVMSITLPFNALVILLPIEAKAMKSRENPLLWTINVIYYISKQQQIMQRGHLIVMT
jgi:hypothetical protein